MQLDVAVVENADGVIVLGVTGSVDLASRDKLLDAGRAALAEQSTRILVLDLGRVDFLDSSGIGVMVELSGEADDSDRGFAVRNLSARVDRTLSIAGLRDHWLASGTG